jgi:hypothetical protein
MVISSSMVNAYKSYGKHALENNSNNEGHTHDSKMKGPVQNGSGFSLRNFWKRKNKCNSCKTTPLCGSIFIVTA